jgi:hypothetical protein
LLFLPLPPPAFAAEEAAAAATLIVKPSLAGSYLERTPSAHTIYRERSHRQHFPCSAIVTE